MILVPWKQQEHIGTARAKALEVGQEQESLRLISEKGWRRQGSGQAHGSS